MKDSIYTIPVNEVFEPKCGCPICTMRDVLEERCVEYIMGAAMMEPDVRIETNEKGFCKLHFDKMMKRKNRLSLALMLESHLKELQKKGIEQGGSTGGFFKKKKMEPQKASCFVCDKIDWAQQRMFDTILKLYAQSEEFRTLYGEQKMLCLPHYRQLTAYAREGMDKKVLPQFLEVSGKLYQNALDEIQKDVSHYCSMFDYRNNKEEADWGNSRDSIERAIGFLTSRPVE
ncbi:MAG: DUF6062 family protein [Massiliimalia sp.]|jgi:hypothetical protein